MTVNTLAQVVFVVLAAITIIEWARYRTRTRLDGALMFAALAVTMGGREAAAWLGLDPVVGGRASAVALLAQPYLLLRLAKHFQRVPRWVNAAAGAGLVLAVGLYLARADDLGMPLTLALVVYFVAAEAYAAALFVRGALTTGGVVRRRLLAASAGSACLAVLILAVGVTILVPAGAPVFQALVPVLILLCGVLYFVAFATPRPLRRAWQLGELYRFLQAAAGQARPLEELCRAANRTAGGAASAAWLWEPEAEVLAWQAADGLLPPRRLRLGEAGPLARVWTERQPIVAPLDEWAAGLAGGTLPAEAAAFLAVPIATRDRGWGVLGVFLRQTSLFPDDDAAALGLLAGQAAEELERAALFNAERRLLEQLAQANAELQAEVVERRQAEQALAQRTAETEELARSLEAVIENIPAMLFIKDAAELRFVRWNKACEEVVGLPREATLGKNDYDFFPRTEAEFFIEKDRAVLTSGQMLDIPEESIHTAHQGVRVLHTRKVPILDAAGTPKYLLGISEDITERRQIEEQIRQLNQSLTQRAALLEAANQELEAFSYSVSHDLRSPLRAIDGFSQALLEDYPDRLDETGQDYLLRIRRAAQRMAQLIDDLLRLAWLSRASMSVEPVDLSALARGIAAELRSADPARTVEVAVPDGLCAQGDARLLRVALENLLGNAWKFTSRQPLARVEMSASDQNGQAVYCVRDNGAGFDTSSAERLFGAFQRMHSTEEFPGTGIGLAIVQRIIQRHGGRIWAESAPGQGAAFYFVLGTESAS